MPVCYVVSVLSILTFFIGLADKALLDQKAQILRLFCLPY